MSDSLSSTVEASAKPKKKKKKVAHNEGVVFFVFFFQLVAAADTVNMEANKQRTTKNVGHRKQAEGDNSLKQVPLQDLLGT